MPNANRLPGSFRNSTQTVYVNTELHRATLLDEDVTYPIETLSQGRDATNKVPAFSMYSGEPESSPDDDEVRRMLWQSYFLAITTLAVCAFLLAVWPN